MIKKINILFLSMFYIGRSKYAPGSVASFVTSFIYIFLFNLQVNIIFLILSVSLIFIISVFSIDQFKNFFDEVDSKEIVIDEAIDVSIPYMATAKLAFEHSEDKSMSYDEFEIKYLADSVRDVIAKRR